ncbi:MAG: hypothetical protein J6Q84_07615 [Kiritimatiellae bacterium]|nr:hypothetical protein [Kiritimatiellia bacterium]
MQSHNNHRVNVRILQYHYDERSIRIWFSNHEVHEYTIDLVGSLVLGEMCRLADSGRGLEAYLQSKALQAVVPRKWMEWLKC